jgi:hypothetical protein
MKDNNEFKSWHDRDTWPANRSAELMLWAMHGIAAYGRDIDGDNPLLIGNDAVPFVALRDGIVSTDLYFEARQYVVTIRPVFTTINKETNDQ